MSGGSSTTCRCCPDEPAHSYVMMEMGVLGRLEPPGRCTPSASLFEKVEGPEHTGPKGIIHPGTSDFVMPIQNAILALAEFQYGRPDHGLWYLQRMAELCDRATPWAIPEFELMRGGYRPCFYTALVECGLQLVGRAGVVPFVARPRERWCGSGRTDPRSGTAPEWRTLRCGASATT